MSLTLYLLLESFMGKDKKREHQTFTNFQDFATACGSKESKNKKDQQNAADQKENKDDKKS